MEYPRPQRNPQQPPVGYEQQQGYGQQPGYGPAPQYGGYYPPPPSAPPVNASGFFQALFDFSFTAFVTPKIIKVIYVLAMIGIALVSLVYVALAFRLNPAVGVLVLVIVAPIFFLLYLIAARVWLEVVMALFRIAENTTEIAQQGKRGP